MTNVSRLFARAAAARNGLGGLGEDPGFLRSGRSDVPQGRDTVWDASEEEGMVFGGKSQPAPKIKMDAADVYGRRSYRITENAPSSPLPVITEVVANSTSSGTPAAGEKSFFSSFTDALSSIPQKTLDSLFGKANAAGPGYNLNVPQPSSPLPWVIGGVAVAGLLAVVLLRSKK